MPQPMRKEKLKPEHLADFIPTSRQKDELGPDWPGDVFTTQGHAARITIGGETIAVAGLAEYQGYHLAWAVLAENSQAHILPLTRFFRKELKKRDRPVLISVRADNFDGLKWARLLGFKFFKRSPDHYLLLHDD